MGRRSLRVGEPILIIIEAVATFKVNEKRLRLCSLVSLQALKYRQGTPSGYRL